MLMLLLSLSWLQVSVVVVVAAVVVVGVGIACGCDAKVDTIIIVADEHDERERGVPRRRMESSVACLFGFCDPTVICERNLRV